MRHRSFRSTHAGQAPDTTPPQAMARGTIRIVVVGWALLIPAFLFGAGLGRNTKTGTVQKPGERAARSATTTAPDGDAGEKPEQHPVLIELFTSQGCSSCPPADLLLRELGQRSDLIPLAFHVDYWNHLGWRDPFSSSRWSDRQRRYAGWFGEDTIYTPQLVVAGTQHLVGSDRRGIQQVLDHASPSIASKALPRLGLRVDRNQRVIEARVDIEAPMSPGEIEVWVALYERNLEIDIGRGENSGRTLEYDYVVRDLRAVQTGKVLSFAIEPTWKANDLGVVAFAQSRSTGAVLTAARTPAPSTERNRHSG